MQINFINYFKIIGGRESSLARGAPGHDKLGGLDEVADGAVVEAPVVVAGALLDVPVRGGEGSIGRALIFRAFLRSKIGKAGGGVVWPPPPPL